MASVPVGDHITTREYLLLSFRMRQRTLVCPVCHIYVRPATKSFAVILVAPSWKLPNSSPFMAFRRVGCAYKDPEFLFSLPGNVI